MDGPEGDPTLFLPPASSLKTVTKDPLLASVLKYPVDPGPKPAPEFEFDLESCPEVPCIRLALLASLASRMASANSLESVVEKA